MSSLPRLWFRAAGRVLLECVFYEISHDRLTDVIARHRTYRLPRWVLPTLALAVLATIVFGGLALVARLQWRAANDARRRTKDTVQLVNEGLESGLRDSGVTDALLSMLNDGAIDPAALRKRREGELAWERNSLAEAEQAFNAALRELDRSQRSADPVVSRERALVVKGLGDIALDRGRVPDAEKRYVEAVELSQRPCT